MSVNIRFFNYLLILSVLTLSSVLLPACGNNNTIHLGLTTTLEETGVLAALITAFENQHPIKIKPVIAGSGQIHRLIEAGDIDTAITHDPKGEKKLLSKKIIQERFPLVKNDFIIVGPSDDPAHIQQALTPDEVLEKIANTDAIFVSRDDQSGTHQMELNWREKIAYTNDKAKIIKTGSGMGATLAVAINKKAYTLVDRGTWLNYANKLSTVLLYEDSDYLPNTYSLLQLKQTRAPQESIRLWEQWLKKEGVEIMKTYRINGHTVFYTQE